MWRKTIVLAMATCALVGDGALGGISSAADPLPSGGRPKGRKAEGIPPHRPMGIGPGAAVGDDLPAVAASQENPDRSRPVNLRTRWIERAIAGLRRLGIWGPAAAVVLMVLCCVACVPGVFLTVADGAVFGLGWGFLYAWGGAQLGASAAFFISRHLAHDWVRRRLVRRPLLSAIEEAVSVEGWTIVALLRLVPGSPFFLLNYVFGLTRVRYWHYAMATAAASAPGTLLFVYIGSLGQWVVSGRIRTVWDGLLYVIGLLAIVVSTTVVARRARKVLRDRLPNHEGKSHHGGREGLSPTEPQPKD